MDEENNGRRSLNQGPQNYLPFGKIGDAEKMSLPGIEPGPLALNAGALTARPQRRNYSKLTVVVITILNQHLNVFGSETCQSIPRNACPYQISEHTGELVQFVAKYLTRDHPEYHARVPEEERDKVNVYCAHPDCHPNPCQNGGTCEEEYVGYSCTCPGIYRHGVNCEIRVCPDNWVYATTKCFLVVHPRNRISFPTAYDYCNGLDAVAMGNGIMEDPSLAFIESNEEHDVLKPLITAGWLWLNCERTGESFVCYNDRGRTMISHYRNWGVGEPTNGDHEDCISFNMADGKMHDKYCYHRRALVCQVIIEEE
ncbi:brevican core protein-like [Lytechinus pictus]|uniref:brevican core protein-like n=1 Tax=Lytechinus pictus TaxID=7653 RepID=UPI0030B9AEB1